jgi:hypothetical protein
MPELVTRFQADRKCLGRHLDITAIWLARDLSEVNFMLESGNPAGHTA